MKTRRFRATFPIATVSAAILLAAAGAAADEPVISGSVDTRFDNIVAADYGDGFKYAFGLEEVANLRLKAGVGEYGTFNAAVNLMAAAGTAAGTAALTPAGKSPFIVGAGYAAGMELERLYFKVTADAFDLEAGLLRLAFGYGQAFGPSDFLSPRNPLLPDARPRGSLGAALSAYPADGIKIKAFAAAGTNPLAADGDGAVGGLALDFHAAFASLQVLYAVEAAAAGADQAVHRIGVSVKADIEIGLTLDALYTLDGAVLSSGRYYDRVWTGTEGLKAAVGADYSFLDGDIYIVMQYLYNGGSALALTDSLERLYAPASGLWSGDWRTTAPAKRLVRADLPLGELNRRDYLYGAVAYQIDDYTRATISAVAGLDDLSFAPNLAWEYEPFQGLAVSLTGRLPTDRRSLAAFAGAVAGGSDGGYGELGPVHCGTVFSLSAKAKMKF